MAFAFLDAAIEEEWEYRYYSYDFRWNIDANEQIGSMRNGSGDFYFELFSENVSFLKLYDREIGFVNKFDRTKYQNHILDLFDEPAFMPDYTSYFAWNERDDGWKIPFPIKESGCLSDVLDGANGYVRFARDYHEIELESDVVEDFIETLDYAKILDTENHKFRPMSDLENDIFEIFG